MNTEEIITYLTTRGSDLAIGIVAAIVILIVGRIVSRWSAKITNTVISKRFEDESLARFGSSMVSIALMAFFIIAAISKVGIQTTSFVAVIGAAGLAVGMALQGSLSNFASGVLILVFRPISVGEVATVGGETGKIEEIGIFTTTLNTPDNKVVIVANSSVTSSNITNFSRKPNRRIDLVFGIDYGDDIRRAKEILMEEMKKCDKVLAEPAPTVGVLELGDNSVNLAARPWAANAHYWDVYFELMENVKYRFDAEGISFPFPQRDVHHYQMESAS